MMRYFFWVTLTYINAISRIQKLLESTLIAPQMNKMIMSVISACLSSIWLSCSSQANSHNNPKPV